MFRNLPGTGCASHADVFGPEPIQELGATMDAKKMMPGLAQTAGGLMMRSHTFNPNPRAARGTTADQLPPPVYAYPK